MGHTTCLSELRLTPMKTETSWTGVSAFGSTFGDPQMSFGGLTDSVFQAADGYPNAAGPRDGAAGMEQLHAEDQSRDLGISDIPLSDGFAHQSGHPGIPYANPLASCLL